MTVYRTEAELAAQHEAQATAQAALAAVEDALARYRAGSLDAAGDLYEAYGPLDRYLSMGRYLSPLPDWGPATAPLPAISPDETLTAMRQAAGGYRKARAGHAGAPLDDCAARMAANWELLTAWLRAGGALPEAWRD